MYVYMCVAVELLNCGVADLYNCGGVGLLIFLCVALCSDAVVYLWGCVVVDL